MATTRLSTKGQLIIPQEIRARHGWEAGTVLEIEEDGDTVILRPALSAPRTTLADLIGCAHYTGPRRTLAEMEDGIAEGARESG